MKYFSKLPLIDYPQSDGSTITMTNIMTRTYLISQTTKEPLLYYEYSLKDSDLPEIVANKYYGASEQFWLLSLSNQTKFLDPQWDWPLTLSNFNLYLTDKYGSVSNAISQIHHYEKKVTNTNVLSGESNEFITIIGAPEYANTIVETSTYTLPNGSQVEQAITKSEVTVYDYEYQANENKRNINLIDADNVSSIEEQFVKLYP
jgi:hypothetical protein